MPPERIDSLNVDSQKGLVLSLLKRIDELFEQNKGLLEQNNSLLARIDELLARIAELEGRAGKPPKTPTNSSLPPSSGQKDNVADASAKKTRKGRPGVARQLCSNPDVTRDIYAERCDCGAKLPPTGHVVAHAYDHVELPPIKPITTRETCTAVTVPAAGRRSPPSRPPTCHQAPRSVPASSRSSPICTAARW